MSKNEGYRYSSSDDDYRYSRSYRSRYSKGDLAGIVGENSQPIAEFSLSDPNTIYSQVTGIATTFDIRKEDLEVAAYYDLATLSSDSTSLATVDLDFPIFNIRAIFSALPPDSLALYDIVVSASAEGKAKGIIDGYAESFFTDEIEVYLGLINEDEFGDPIVGALEIDIELKRKVDILIDGGLQSIDAVLAYLDGKNLLRSIEEIEIKYQNEPTLAADLGSIANQIAGSIVSTYGSQLEGLIEIERDDVNPSKWAASAFVAMRPDII
jgi:hypothetical protein